MLQELLTQKIDDQIYLISQFRPVVAAYSTASIASLIFFILLTFALRSRTPIFFAQKHEAKNEAAPQSTADDGGLMFFAGLFSIWATYQYVVHGNAYVTTATNALMFLFFGQLYVITTGLQAVRHTRKFAIVTSIAKVLTAGFSLIITSVLLSNSASYQAQLPDELTQMDIGAFLKYLIKNIFQNNDWVMYIIQQGLGIASRFLILLISTAIIVYHVAVRFPAFCTGYPRLYRNLAGFNSGSSYTALFVFSLMSNDLLKGSFIRNINLFIELIGKAIFTA